MRQAVTWVALLAFLLVARLSATPTLAASGLDDRRDVTVRIRNLILRIETEQSSGTRADLGLQLSDLVRHTDPAEIGPGEIDAIARLLRSRNDSIRAWAAAALGDIGPRARRAIPALEKALREVPMLYAGSIMKPELDSSAAIVPALERIRGEPRDSAMP